MKLLPSSSTVKDETSVDSTAKIPIFMPLAFHQNSSYSLHIIYAHRQLPRQLPQATLDKLI